MHLKINATHKNKKILNKIYYIDKLNINNYDSINNDGWILYSDNLNSDIYKIKPYNKLTLDLLYKNNKLYKIPNVYKLSKNIIIMDYIEADTIEKFSDNNIKYSKYNLEIFIFSNNNLFVNNFNHGDLHNYNWKITNDKKIS